MLDNKQNIKANYKRSHYCFAIVLMAFFLEVHVGWLNGCAVGIHIDAYATIDLMLKNKSAVRQSLEFTLLNLKCYMFISISVMTYSNQNAVVLGCVCLYTWVKLFFRLGPDSPADEQSYSTEETDHTSRADTEPPIQSWRSKLQSLFPGCIKSFVTDPFIVFSPYLLKTSSLFYGPTLFFMYCGFVCQFAMCI